MTPRPLTDGEIKLARTLFGDSIDYPAVKVTDEKYVFFQPKGTAMAPNGNLYMHGCYHADFSKEDSLTRGHFIHEMTHVWQYQNKILNPVTAAVELNLKHTFNYAASYAFHLDETKDLTRYGMEQQAAIVQEYFLTRHEGMTRFANQCKNDCGAEERLSLYEKVLKKFLENPSYAKRDKFPKPFRSGKPEA